MKYFFLVFLLPNVAEADSFSDGVGRIEVLQRKTQSLLSRAGILDAASSTHDGQESSHTSFFKLHASLTSALIPAGGLAFGKTYLRLLVGDEASPIQIIFSGGRYPLLEGMKALGTAVQSRGRVFADFDRLVMKSGKAIPIKAQLLDRTGALGLKGENENSKLLEVAGGVGVGLVAVSEEPASQFGSIENFRPSVSERLRSSLLSETRGYLRDQFKETPVLRVDIETGVTLLFKEEVRF